MGSAAGPVGPRALASDKLFFSLFQDSPDLVLRWPLEWYVVVICPHRQLNFGPLWVELQPRDGQEPAEPLTQVLSLLVQPKRCSSSRLFCCRGSTTDPSGRSVPWAS